MIGEKFVGQHLLKILKGQTNIGNKKFLTANKCKYDSLKFDYDTIMHREEKI